jgi:hypothetical protein
LEFGIWKLEFPGQTRALWVPACPGCGQTKKTWKKILKNDILYPPEILLHRSDKVPYRKDKVSNRSDKLPFGKDKVTVITKFGPGVRSCQAVRELKLAQKIEADFPFCSHF